MNLQTRLLMSISAFVLFVIGVAFSFVSQEILEAVHGRAEPATVVTRTGRRPMRSESRPQIGAKTNCAAA